MVSDRDDFAEQPPIQPPIKPKMLSFGMGGGTAKTVFVSFVVTFVVLLLMSFAGGVSFVTKKDFNANMANIATALEEGLADLAVAKADVSSAIQGVSTTISNQVNAAISQSTVQLTSSIQGNTAILNQLAADVGIANSKISAFEDRIAELEGLVAGYEERISALESPPSGSAGGSTIPNVSITAKVIDEGTLRVSDNATLGEFKLTLDNSGAYDIEDVVLYVYVYFEDCASANQTILSASYGSWSIGDRHWDEMELKGRLTRLDAGDSRRIYIQVVSWGKDGHVTYLDTSSSDVEVVDWNYGD